MPKEPAAPVAPPAEPVVPELPDITPDVLAALLDRYSDDPEKRALLLPRLKSNRFVSGIVGELNQQQNQQRETEAARSAIEAERDRLKRLRKDDPLAYAEEMDTKEELEEAHRKTAELRATTEREFGESIGSALKDLPEFAELTQQDWTKLANDLAVVPKEKQLAAYVRLATDLVATKRGSKHAEATIQARLTAERKAWEAEQRTTRLKQRQAPDTLTPPSPSANGQGAEPADSNSKEWDLWYRKNVLRRAS